MSRLKQFQGQAAIFIQETVTHLGCEGPDALRRLSTRRPVALEPIVLNNYKKIATDEKRRIIESYYSEYGVAYFVSLNHHEPPHDRHAIFDIVYQLREDLHLKYPLVHPLEDHPERNRRFGPSDGTVKVYNLEERTGQDGYREQGETSEMFDMHHDGLGSGGTVQTVVLYAESPPLFGGYTFFLNVPQLALELARDDFEAFDDLFLPDALTIVRPRGKGAIRVVTPVLFLNESGEPQSFFRVGSGEYQVYWRTNRPALSRARVFLERHARPFACGSSFLHFAASGHGCLVRNRAIAHGRTQFFDGPRAMQKRVLARKWYMCSSEYQEYRHVPGMSLLPSYAELYPELFAAKYLEGEWLYDAEAGENKRVH